MHFIFLAVGLDLLAELQMIFVFWESELLCVNCVRVEVVYVVASEGVAYAKVKQAREIEIQIE